MMQKQNNVTGCDRHPTKHYGIMPVSNSIIGRGLGGLQNAGEHSPHHICGVFSFGRDVRTHSTNVTLMSVCREGTRKSCTVPVFSIRQPFGTAHHSWRIGGGSQKFNTGNSRYE